MKILNQIPPLTCEICGEAFKTEKGFNSHLSRKHSIDPKSYWEKHWPRKNLSNGKPLSFFSYPDYFLKDFESVTQCKKYLRENPEIAQNYLSRILEYRIDHKTLQFAPSHLDLCFSSCPGVDYFEQFGGYEKICAKLGIEPMFPLLDMPKWNDKKQKEVIIDNREQKPLEFSKATNGTLSYGDYSMGGKTAVERKSLQDLLGTLGKNNLDRFCREIQRAVDNDGYLWVLVEDAAKNIDKIYWCNRAKRKGQYKDYVFSKIKELQNAFPRRIQFCFTGSREKSEELVPILLSLDSKAWLVDLQYAIIK